MTYTKPLPVPDEHSAPFWDAAKRHILCLQECTHCGTHAHPPVEFCAACNNMSDPQFVFTAVSGRGKIINWTVMRESAVAGFADDAPWVSVLVELDDQPGLLMVASLEGGPDQPLALGASVEVTFHDVTDQMALPWFRRTLGTGNGIEPGAAQQITV